MPAFLASKGSMLLTRPHPPTPLPRVSAFVGSFYLMGTVWKAAGAERPAHYVRAGLPKMWVSGPSIQGDRPAGLGLALSRGLEPSMHSGAHSCPTWGVFPSGCCGVSTKCPLLLLQPGRPSQVQPWPRWVGGSRGRPGGEPEAEVGELLARPSRPGAASS